MPSKADGLHTSACCHCCSNGSFSLAADDTDAAARNGKLEIMLRDAGVL